MSKPWSKQNKRKGEQDVPNQEKVYDLAESIPESEFRCLFVLSYLTAGRISEVLSIHREDVELTEERGRKIILISMRNKKNQIRKRKKIPIPIDLEYERNLFKLIVEYITKVPVGNKLFNRSKFWANKRFNKYVEFNPHWIRHTRLTHLVTLHNFSDQKLVMFAGWTDSRPCKHYMELRHGDIMY